jgi:polar amino acid transport system permease protein
MNFVHDFLNIHIVVLAIPQLLRGFLVTIEIALFGTAGGITLGLILAVARVTILRPKTPRAVRWINVPMTLYVDAFRSVPALVLLIVVYFALPFLGIYFSRFLSASLTFVVIISAFAEEIFRGGIESIDKGQLQAARALGMGYLHSMRHVVVPQAVRIVIPTLTSRVISITKDVSLASVIGVSDLLKQATVAQGHYANSSPLMAATLLFILLFLPLVQLSVYLERRFK